MHSQSRFDIACCGRPTRASNWWDGVRDRQRESGVWQLAQLGQLRLLSSLFARHFPTAMSHQTTMTPRLCVFAFALDLEALTQSTHAEILANTI